MPLQTPIRGATVINYHYGASTTAATPLLPERCCGRSVVYGTGRCDPIARHERRKRRTACREGANTDIIEP